MAGEAGLNLHRYVPPGPVGAAFLQSRGPIDIIMGPAGSGKTVASAFKGPLLASTFAPVCADGVIRVRQATIRDTYRDLARTCLSSWYEMFPPDGPLTAAHEGGQDRPVIHKLKWNVVRPLPGGRLGKVPVDFTMQFGAIGDANIESFIKGYEITFGWMNECDLLDERVPGLLLQRTGRYPKFSDIADAELQRLAPLIRENLGRMGLTLEEGETLLPRLVWGDMNPPDIGHWTYRKMVKPSTRRPGWNLFRQPSGLSPRAENRKGKPRSSYELEAGTMTAYDKRRYVDGEFGYALDGTPVYPEFRLDFHSADAPLTPRPNIPIGLGIDAGGSPAAGIGQFLPSGQMLMLAEVCAAPGTGPSRFAEMLLDVLMTRFRGFAISEAWADPSSFHGADRLAGELAWVETVARALNVNILPAPSNEPSIRQEAVRWYLGAPIDAHTPRLLIGSDLEVTIGGFAAHYKLSKQATAGATDKIVVVKNEYSHIHDAWQYICLGHRGRAGVITDASRLGRGENVVSMRSRRANTDFDVWAT